MDHVHPQLRRPWGRGIHGINKQWTNQRARSGLYKLCVPQLRAVIFSFFVFNKEYTVSPTNVHFTCFLKVKIPRLHLNPRLKVISMFICVSEIFFSSFEPRIKTLASILKHLLKPMSGLFICLYIYWGKKSEFYCYCYCQPEPSCFIRLPLSSSGWSQPLLVFFPRLKIRKRQTSPRSVSPAEISTAWKLPVKVLVFFSFSWL